MTNTTALLVGLAVGAAAGLAINAAVKRSRADAVAAEVAESTPADVVPASRPRPLVRVPYNPRSLQWAPMPTGPLPRRARPVRLVIALVRLTIAAMAALCRPVPEIRAELRIPAPVAPDFPRAYRAPRVDLWSLGCRRAIPVRGPDRLFPSRPFPRCEVLM